MSILHAIAALVVLIGVLVSVHEYGHYWVAKRCGVKVLTFSIGFGKALYAWSIGETRWQVAMIPLGGYVKMLDEREGPVAAAELDRAFNRQSLGKRVAIVLAGPVANLLLAVLLYWGLFLGGVDVVRPHIGYVAPDSVASRAGFVVGEDVDAVDGIPVESWNDVRLALIDRASAGELAHVNLRRTGGGHIVRVVDFSSIAKAEYDGELADRVGLAPVAYHARISAVLPGEAAEKAGLQRGDVMVSVEGQAVPGASEFTAAVRARPGLPTHVRVTRAGQTLDLTITPTSATVDGKVVGRIGAEVGSYADEASIQQITQHVDLTPIAALGKAAWRTIDTSVFSLKMLWRMATGHVSVKQLSGPVAIAGYAGQSASLGLKAYIEFLCIISISLGVFNLLPIPVLDGGHLLYYSAELLRGRPLSERAMELGQRAGVGLLAALMAVALYNDILRMVSH
ncbi:MAG: RIP metalloprotease RseP [Burkholderiales bacterium]|nr:RIP metalloprotease RseP [Burkholderiales bacterium]